MTIWTKLQEALIGQFEKLRLIKIARDKFSRLRQIEEVLSFNEDFQKFS